MAIECIYVNLHLPVNEVCIACLQDIAGKSYLRDLKTRIVYHNKWCFDAHVESSEKRIGASHESAQTL